MAAGWPDAHAAPMDQRSALRVSLPPVVFGTSALGNLYRTYDDDERRRLLAAALADGDAETVFDCAGKYGAGLSLAALGRLLPEFAGRRIRISNKLGWRRAPLRGPEPMFEPGVWHGLDHDAVQDISEDGILRCWEEGCVLLGAELRPALVSVHDPDEYLAAAPRDGRRRWEDIHGAYRSLTCLRDAGEVEAIGIGAKDWRIARRVAETVDLDWVMLACSLTPMRHPPELLAFIADLHRRGVQVVNAGIFHGGFITGGGFLDYRPIAAGDAQRLRWRAGFLATCAAHGVAPDAACVQFGLAVPGVVSVALNCADAPVVAASRRLPDVPIPAAFWRALKDGSLIDRGFPWLG